MFYYFHRKESKLTGKNTLIYSKQVILSENMTIKKIALVMDHSPNLITDMIFYATQTMLAPDGRRLVFGWMDMWESDFPEKADGWAGALTLPRELILKDDKLYMRPIKELSQLRTAKLATWDKNLTQKTLLCEGEKQAELELTLDSADFSLTLNDPKTSAQIKLSFDQKTQTFILENGDKRYATITSKSKLKLQLFIDTSSLEIFINDGEVRFY